MFPGNMTRGSLILILAFFAAAPALTGRAADPKYTAAQKCYLTLDKSQPRQWDRCLNLFQDVVAENGPEKEMLKALFSVGRLSQEKYERTRNTEDLERAFKNFNAFLRQYPKSSMADDALYRIGVLRYEEQQDTARARRAFQALIDRYPYADMAVPASKYLQRLQKVALKEEPAKPALVASAGKPPVITAPEGSLPVPPPEAEKKSAGGGIKEEAISSKAAGEKIRKVVIDPGHGGEDTGAVGPGGTREAAVALQLSRKVAFLLRHHLGLEVHLTRTHGGAVSLDARNLFANNIDADLFVSIHANANTSPNVTGVQTFFLNNATSEASKRLADRENSGAGKPVDLSERILTTMLQNANTDDSRDLAQSVQASLVGRLQKDYKDIRDLGVDASLFYVLVGAKCPGILVESSFLSNPREETRLRDSDYQWTVAEGVARGIQAYIEKRDKLAFASSL